MDGWINELINGQTLVITSNCFFRDDFKLAVLELRQRQKMSLTGLPLEAVIEKVKKIFLHVMSCYIL